MAEASIREDRILDEAFQPDGVMGQIALRMVEEGIDLTAIEAANVIKTPTEPGIAPVPRWQKLAEASDIKKAAIAEHAPEVMELADTLRLRRSRTVTDADLAAIEPARAVWLIEGGGNRTSVVRRQVANDVMRMLLPTPLEDAIVYQLGADDRVIPPKEGTNPEYQIAQKIAPNFVDDTIELTEHGLNIATALQSGYELDTEGDVDVMQRAGFPRLVQLAVSSIGGTQEGLDRIRMLEGGMKGRQLVIATNGQYRPKYEEVARQWAHGNGIDMLKPLVIGDEAGYEVPHLAGTIATQPRGPLVYAHELATLLRLKHRRP